MINKFFFSALQSSTMLAFYTKSIQNTWEKKKKAMLLKKKKIDTQLLQTRFADDR